MKIERHGLLIGIERVGSTFFLSIKAVGNLNHEDYTIISPMIDSALEGVRDPKVNTFFDASELEGWELRAAWDDFKIGLKHGNEFGKVAIFGGKKWLERTAKIASWFVSGEVKYFDDMTAAVEWLRS